MAQLREGRTEFRPPFVPPPHLTETEPTLQQLKNDGFLFHIMKTALSFWKKIRQGGLDPLYSPYQKLKIKFRPLLTNLLVATLQQFETGIWKQKFWTFPVPIWVKNQNFKPNFAQIFLIKLVFSKIFGKTILKLGLENNEIRNFFVNLVFRHFREILRISRIENFVGKQ